MTIDEAVETMTLWLSGPFDAPEFPSEERTEEALRVLLAELERAAAIEVERDGLLDARNELDRQRDDAEEWQQRAEAAEARAAKQDTELRVQLERMADNLEAAEARLREVEGESRVLIGCPCRCHDGSSFRDPHPDCRECVRGSAVYGYWYTPQQIDNDHEWALWHEKWVAQVDTTASYAARLREVEAELADVMRSYQEMGAAWKEKDDEVRKLREALDIRGRVIAMMTKRGWSLEWIHRSAYLHLEAAELAEAVRGKRGDPIEEAADVLITLLALAPAGLDVIVSVAERKIASLMDAPPYPHETRAALASSPEVR